MKSGKSGPGRPSLIRIMVAAQLVFLFVLLAFGIGSIAAVNRSEERRVLQEQRADADREAARLKEELSGYQNIMWELFIHVTEAVDLVSGEKGARYFAIRDLLERMQDITTYNPGIEFCFAGRDGTIIPMKPGYKSFDALSIREWIAQQRDNNFAGYSPVSWSILQLADETYLLFFLTGDECCAGCLVSAGRKAGTLLDIAGQGGFVKLLDDQGRSAGFGETAAGKSVDGREDQLLDIAMENGLSLALCLGSQARLSRRFPITVGVLGLLCLAAFVAQTVLVYRLSVRPVRALSARLGDFGEELATGGVPVEIPVNASTDEILRLQSSIRHLLDEVMLGRMRDYEHRLQNQEMELLLMRSQLRPHFYLNALTTIDAMTYQDRNEDIRRFLQALSVHVRYMLRTDESGITLGEELRHIGAYLDMQGIRYPDRIFYVLDLPEELSGTTIPHLLIYTVVENCFKYALGVEETLLLMISAQKTEDGVSVTVEDNGNGYPPEVIALINSENMPQMTEEQKGHIGLRNVRRTLELAYGRKGLIHISNVPDASGEGIQGARTVLIFPEPGDRER